MTQFHPDQVRKIWQRVQTGPAYEQTVPAQESAATCTGLYTLVNRELMIQALLVQLAKRGKHSAVLRKLAMQARSHASMLRGMCAVTEEKIPTVHIPKTGTASTAVLLRRCYGYTQQNLWEYEKRTSDSRFGSVFEKMAEQEKAQCRILLSLMGNY